MGGRELASRGVACHGARVPRDDCMAALLFGADPPGEEAMRLRLQAHGVEVSDGSPDPSSEWGFVVRHPVHGVGRVARPRGKAEQDFLPGELMLRSAPNLTVREATVLRSARAAIGVVLAVEAGGSPRRALRDGKRLLWFARTALGDDGLGAIDVDAQRPWSPAELDDELAHDADLDVESVFGVHAVSDGGVVRWLHSHGLAELGSFDFDIIDPSPRLFAPGVYALRALASAILEGAVTPSTPSFDLAQPGGRVRFVPAADFDRGATARGGRTPDAVRGHVEARAVVCEPAGWLGRLLGRVEPSRFLSSSAIPDGTVFMLSTEATTRLADRARRTLGRMWSLREELGERCGPALAKLGYPTPSGSREHLWFEVHRFLDGRLDATCVNAPWEVPELAQGKRGEHDVALVSDWVILTPVGPITPASQTAARRLREAGQRPSGMASVGSDESGVIVKGFVVE